MNLNDLIPIWKQQGLKVYDNRPTGPYAKSNWTDNTIVTHDSANGLNAAPTNPALGAYHTVFGVYNNQPYVSLNRHWDQRPGAVAGANRFAGPQVAYAGPVGGELPESLRKPVGSYFGHIQSKLGGPMPEVVGHGGMWAKDPRYSKHGRQAIEGRGFMPYVPWQAKTTIAPDALGDVAGPPPVSQRGFFQGHPGQAPQAVAPPLPEQAPQPVVPPLPQQAPVPPLLEGPEQVGGFEVPVMNQANPEVWTGATPQPAGPDFSRQPVVNQANPEVWTGATPQPAGPDFGSPAQAAPNPIAVPPPPVRKDNALGMQAKQFAGGDNWVADAFSSGGDYADVGNEIMSTSNNALDAIWKIF